MFHMMSITPSLTLFSIPCLLTRPPLPPLLFLFPFFDFLLLCLLNRKAILTYSLIACQIFRIKFALRTAAHRAVNPPNSTANPSRHRRHCHCHSHCHRIPLGLCYTFALCHCHCHSPMPRPPPSSLRLQRPLSGVAVQKCFQSCRR